MIGLRARRKEVKCTDRLSAISYQLSVAVFRGVKCQCRHGFYCIEMIITTIYSPMKRQSISILNTSRATRGKPLQIGIWLNNAVCRGPSVSCLLCTKDVIITLFCLCFTRQECLENVSCAGTTCNLISSVRYYHHTETSANSEQRKHQTEQNSS